MRSFDAKHPLFVLIYAAASLSAMVTAPMPMHWLAHFTLKALPVTLLIIATAGDLRRLGAGRYRVFLLAGLVASVIGDVVIELAFLAGIVAFLVGHVLYVTGMGLPVGRAHWAALPVVAACWVGMYMLLAPRVPAELYVPVVAYMSVIMLMLFRALGNFFTARRNAAYLFMAVGAVFFVTSDSGIAINRWVVPIPYERFVILGTYFLAQWLIALSANVSTAQAAPVDDGRLVVGR